MYDLIGDIHGHADELLKSLERLGYRNVDGVYCHPHRTAVFLGDFIDRGPQIRKVLQIVRPMVERGAAVAVLGNHEFNAMAYHTRHPRGGVRYLREHSVKNKYQHQATLDQLSEEELNIALGWFRTLPLYLELKGVRVVHACWHPAFLETIAIASRRLGHLSKEFMVEACDEDSDLYQAVETVLKGPEAKLPDGITFKDKDGHSRSEVRTRWYKKPQPGQTYSEYALQAEPPDCKTALTEEVLSAAHAYPSDDVPVFFGHYWLSCSEDAPPQPLADNVACVDYSVAKHGHLCFYRWDGEQKLDAGRFGIIPAATVTPPSQGL